MLLWRIKFFFFQAEDGIRDKLVTGVQTCALPICRRSRAASPSARRCCSGRDPFRQGRWKTRSPPRTCRASWSATRDRKSVVVGKKWSSRWAQDRREHGAEDLAERSEVVVGREPGE